MEVLFDHRAFLNKPGFHSSGAVVALLSVEGDVDSEWANTLFTLSDCSRQVSLSIDCGDKESLDNSLYKLEQIKLAAAGLQKALRAHRRKLKS